jgi:hypothetical protein
MFSARRCAADRVDRTESPDRLRDEMSDLRRTSCCRVATARVTEMVDPYDVVIGSIEQESLPPRNNL